MTKRNRLFLNSLDTITFRDYSRSMNGEVPRFIITPSGYEARSIYWSEQSLGLMKNASNKWVVYGYSDLASLLSRPRNDEFYNKAELPILTFCSREYEPVLKDISERLVEFMRQAGANPIEVHVDYSCMPRQWYSRLPGLLEQLLRKVDTAYFWYSEGRYGRGDYPTAGIDDFEVFSGHPTMRPRSRAHFLGLGLDAARSMSIYRVLEPETLVCFYGKATPDQDLEETIENRQADLLGLSDFHLALAFSDFKGCFSRLSALTKEFLCFGDVILVPDGPKPLIMACSLIPDYLYLRGITAFNVNRDRTGKLTPVDVTATGGIYGFSFIGSSA